MTVNDPQHDQLDADAGDSLGDSRVDAAVASLHDLDERDVDRHPEVYERAHEELRQALDDESQPSAGTPPDTR
jgi:hypothetical protein